MGWHRPLISALKNQRQVDLFLRPPSLQSKFRVSQGCYRESLFEGKTTPHQKRKKKERQTSSLLAGHFWCSWRDGSASSVPSTHVRQFTTSYNSRYLYRWSNALLWPPVTCIIKNKSMVVYIYNFSTQKVKKEGSWVSGQAGLSSETLSQIK